MAAPAETSASRCLFIPIKDSEEAVSIPVNEMPNDVEEVLDVFRGEIAPLDTWLDFAVEYYRQGKISQFLAIIGEGSSPEIAEFYEESKVERVAVLTTHAAHFLNKAQCERDKAERVNQLSAAEKLYETAEKIDTASESVFLGKGFLLFVKGDMSGAHKNFEFARSFSKQIHEGQNVSIPAFLGMAAVHFNKGEFQQALELFSRVIKMDPGSPANTRLGLALCLMQLKQFAAARLALERVLQLEPDNCDAITQLAILDINSGQVEEGFRALSKAFELNPLNGLVLVCLAEYFFLHGQLQEAEQLATKALQVTSSARISSVAHLRLAQIAHKQDDMKGAYQGYTKAAQGDPTNAQPLYGLAQCHVHRNELGFAVQSLEKVLELSPNAWEPKRLLGILYSRIEKPKVGAALQLLKQVIEVQPQDTDTLIEIGELQVHQHGSGNKEAKDALDKFKQVEATGSIPHQSWNNLGAVLHKNGDIQGALEAYRHALPDNTLTDDDTLAIEPSELAKTAEHITVVYNIARGFEELKKDDKAKELYKKIIEGNPTYIDAYMRLCKMDDDESWLLKALEHDTDNVLVRLQLGTNALDRRDWSKAQHEFDRCLKTDKSSVYALLSMGNVFLHSWKGGEEKNLNRAADFYTRSLRRQPNNTYAAHGVACVLAEKGRFEEAKEVLDFLHEHRIDSCDMLVNLGHARLKLGDCHTAASSYRKALEHITQKGATATSNVTVVRQHLARCLMLDEDFEGAAEVLQGVQEQDAAFKFNLAIVKYRNTRHIFTQKDPNESDMQAAGTCCKEAKVLFEQLQGIAAVQTKDSEKSKKYGIQKLPFNEKLITEYIDKCSELESSFDKIEAKAKERQAKKADAWQGHLDEAARIRQFKAEKDAEAAAGKEEAKRKLEAMAAEDEQQLQDLQSSWENTQAMAMARAQEKEDNKAKKSKKKEQLEVVEEDNSEEEPEAQFSGNDDDSDAEALPTMTGMSARADGVEKWDAKKPDATAGSDNESGDSPTKPAAEEPKRRLLKKRPRAEDASDNEQKEGDDDDNENKSGNDDDNKNENDGASEPAAEGEDDGGGGRKRGRRTIVDSDEDE